MDTLSRRHISDLASHVAALDVEDLGAFFDDLVVLMKRRRSREKTPLEVAQIKLLNEVLTELIDAVFSTSATTNTGAF
jgi:hypothetical protein